MSFSDDASEDISWISWFVSVKGNEFFCEVDEDWIRDRFNLCGLQEIVPHFRLAYERILDDEAVMDDHLTSDEVDAHEAAAEMLYGLIHARWILTNQGIAQMAVKYRDACFGTCPRVMCFDQKLLPIGLSDSPGEEKVKLFCPRCRDIYHPKQMRHRQVDGSYFGTSFPQMFFMVHPEKVPDPPTKQFQPKMYGFRIHPSATGPGKVEGDIESPEHSSQKQKAPAPQFW